MKSKSKEALLSLVSGYHCRYCSNLDQEEENVVARRCKHDIEVQVDTLEKYIETLTQERVEEVLNDEDFKDHDRGFLIKDKLRKKYLENK